MNIEKAAVTTGVPDLDRLLGGGVFIGDNVVWYDEEGILASVFNLNLIQASAKGRKHIIYVSVDRSPKNLLERLGKLADSPWLIILDCFTHGLGESSDIFLEFYKRKKPALKCRLVCVEEPRNMERVSDAFYGLHRKLPGDVRFVFESLTGMQSLWGGEEQILKFYSSACPRLYELNTVAYWVVEKRAHTDRLKAHFNKVTQVAVDLSIRRGKTYLSVEKAEDRDTGILNNPVAYWNKGLAVSFDAGRSGAGPIDVGRRIKDLRNQRGISQNDLARRVGVTPSNISQIENSLIFPSIPMLMRLAEMFSVGIGYFFDQAGGNKPAAVFSQEDAVPVTLPGMNRQDITVKQLLPSGMETPMIPYLIEFSPGAILPGHFLVHKKEEAGCLLSGRLAVTIENKRQDIDTGDFILLTSGIPSQWENRGRKPARLLWIMQK
jgi:transcriptional regulator with XRE-family HTH domain/KaiC/GvpD/RAD55 family RecA-like ATPase